MATVFLNESKLILKNAMKDLLVYTKGWPKDAAVVMCDVTVDWMDKMLSGMEGTCPVDLAELQPTELFRKVREFSSFVPDWNERTAADWPKDDAYARVSALVETAMETGELTMRRVGDEVKLELHS